MWWWKMMGLTFAWTIAGALMGVSASIVLAAAFGVVLAITSERSPGSDPLVALGFLWGFILAPAGAAAGAGSGALWCITRRLFPRSSRRRDAGRIAFLLLLPMLAAAGCSTPPEREIDRYPHYERAVAEIALASVGEESPFPDEDKPELGRCKVCNGTGKVGDGQVFTTCQTCGGDGKVDPDDIDKPYTAPTGDGTPAGEIVLHISDITKRGWPDQWYRGKEAFEDRGWSVRYEPHPIDKLQAAYLDVCDGEKCWQFYGPIKPDDIAHMEPTK